MPECPKCHRPIFSRPQAAYWCEECDEGTITETDLMDPSALVALLDKAIDSEGSFDGADDYTVQANLTAIRRWILEGR
jgi:hypothetical protein